MSFWRAAELVVLGGGAALALFAVASNNARLADHPHLAPESMMAQKEHGTCSNAVQNDLRWSCRVQKADEICCFNRHYAEHSGYWVETSFLAEEKGKEPITFSDSVTGKPLFVFDPNGPRSFQEFKRESLDHGWPSFRDEDVVWENVRVLANGEAISVDGTQ
jgi:hypothetical protein